MERIINKMAGLVITLLVVLTACEDLLEITPETSETEENAFQREEDAILAISAVYDPLQWQFHGELGDAYAFTWMYQGLRSGDLSQDVSGGFFAQAAEFENLDIAENNLFVKTVWFKLFSGVFRANSAIGNITKMPDDVFTGDTKARLIAEAKFLRGLYYFELVRNFGGVPLFTEVLDVSNIKVPRSPAENVYEQIETDLEEAAAALPPSYEAGNLGRATSLAANGLLAKVFLYQEKHTEAKTAAEAVIAHEGEYVNLEENYGDNWSLDNEYGIESLFEVGYLDNEIGGTFSIQNDGSLSAQFTSMNVAGTLLTGWQYNLPRQDLYNAFEPGDERLDATIIHEGSTFNSQIMTDEGLNPMPGNFLTTNNPVTGLYSKKFFITPETAKELSSLQRSPLNEKLLRYADVLLIHAEASLTAGGDGLTSLNKVRERAGLSPLGGYDLNDIVQERRVELANEGQRFYDLVRWGIAASVLPGFDSNKDELLPIPFDEIITAGTDENGENVLSQNPGYN